MFEEKQHPGTEATFVVKRISVPPASYDDRSVGISNFFQIHELIKVYECPFNYIRVTRRTT